MYIANTGIGRVFSLKFAVGLCSKWLSCTTNSRDRNKSINIIVTKREHHLVLMIKSKNVNVK